MIESVAVLIPVYNDWVSLEQVIQQLDATAAQIAETISILVINDGSNIDPPSFSFAPLKHIKQIRCIHLVTNQGHQRAIAIGLVILAKENHDAVIVMDSDGEDRPQDISVLLEHYRQNRDHIVVAQRGVRSEGTIFKMFYAIYKLLFWMLTGDGIRFGNYCLIPRRHLAKVVYKPDLWNHLAATIRRSRFPLLEVPTPRGKRIAGQSSMNFTGLVLHGLSSISVYLDLVAVRILIFSLLVAALAVLGIAVTVIVRYFTQLAIPGWATNVVGLLTIITLQTILFSAAVLFGILNARSRRQIIPAIDAVQFIHSQEDWLRTL